MAKETMYNKLYIYILFSSVYMNAYEFLDDLT